MLEPLSQTWGFTAAQCREPEWFSAPLVTFLCQVLPKGSETETVNWKKKRCFDRLFLIFFSYVYFNS